MLGTPDGAAAPGSGPGSGCAGPSGQAGTLSSCPLGERPSSPWAVTQLHGGSWAPGFLDRGPRLIPSGLLWARVGLVVAGSRRSWGSRARESVPGLCAGLYRVHENSPSRAQAACVVLRVCVCAHRCPHVSVSLVCRVTTSTRGRVRRVCVHTSVGTSLCT